MSKTVGELTGKLARTPKVIVDARKRGLQAVAVAGKQAFRSAPGAPRGLVAKRPLNVTTSITEDTVSIRWGQAARLVNDPTRPHFIRPRASGSAKNQFKGLAKTGQLKSTVRGMAIAGFLGAISGNRQTIGGGIRHAVNIPGVGPRSYAHHPGTKGKHFVELGKEKARVAIPAAYAKEHRAGLATLFKEV